MSILEDIFKPVLDALPNIEIPNLFDDSKGAIIKFKEGGSVNWIGKATKEMKKKGTVGLFTKKAKEHGLSAVNYAKKVIATPQKHTIKTFREAMFVKNANPELFASGGEIKELWYVTDYKDNVKNISTTEKEANTFLNKALKHSGQINYVQVPLADWENEKVSVSNIKHIAKSHYASGGSVRYSSKRKGPSNSATWYSPGEIQIGNDGNYWRVAQNVNGVNRWVKMDDGGRVTDLNETHYDFNWRDVEHDVYQENGFPTKHAALKRIKEIQAEDGEVVESWIYRNGKYQGSFYGKGGKTQGYADRQDESLGMRRGKQSSKKVSAKGRRDDSYGKWGKRDAENRGTSMAKGGKTKEYRDRARKENRGYGEYIDDTGFRISDFGEPYWEEIYSREDLKKIKNLKVGESVKVTSLLRPSEDVRTAVSKHQPELAHSVQGHAVITRTYAKGGETQGYNARMAYAKGGRVENAIDLVIKKFDKYYSEYRWKHWDSQEYNGDWFVDYITQEDYGNDGKEILMRMLGVISKELKVDIYLYYIIRDENREGNSDVSTKKGYSKVSRDDTYAEGEPEQEALERGGFDPDTLTEEQKNLILQPQEGPENFYMDGEMSPTQALKYWKERLKSSGLTIKQVIKAERMYFDG